MNIMVASHQWKTWRIVTTEDTLITDWGSSNLTDATKVIAVRPYSAIMIRCFGEGVENDTANIYITGWMGDVASPPLEVGRGPGQRLIASTAILGATTTTDDILDDGKWPVITETEGWREVDVYGLATNAPSAAAFAGNAQTSLVIPTLWYTHLMLEVFNIDGTDEPTTFGVIWRDISARITI